MNHHVDGSNKMKKPLISNDEIRSWGVLRVDPELPPINPTFFKTAVSLWGTQNIWAQPGLLSSKKRSTLDTWPSFFQSLLQGIHRQVSFRCGSDSGDNPRDVGPGRLSYLHYLIL